MNSNNTIWKKVFKKNKQVIARDIAQETILVPIRGNMADMQKIFTLNPVAEYIWQQLNGKNDLAKIRNGILGNFDVCKKQADADIKEFIRQLIEAGLIEERN